MTEINFNKMRNEIIKDYSIITLLICVISSILITKLTLIAALLIFASFDYIVFQRIVKTDIELKGLIPYRFVQTLFQIGLGYLIYLSSGTIETLWFILFWWFGICDTLFYLLGNEINFIEYDDMFWIWWTPLGILNLILKRKSSAKTLILNNLIVIILYIILG